MMYTVSLYFCAPDRSIRHTGRTGHTPSEKGAVGVNVLTVHQLLDVDVDVWET